MKGRNALKRSDQVRNDTPRGNIFVVQDSIFNMDEKNLDPEYEYFSAKIPTDHEEEVNRILDIHLTDRDFDFVDKSDLPGVKIKENPYGTLKRSGTESHYTQKDHVLLRRAKDNPVRLKELKTLQANIRAEDNLMSNFESNPYGLQLQRKKERVIGRWVSPDESSPDGFE